MDKNILIVHYNTPQLTECLVKSINKHTHSVNIYIFDNSDKLPFTAKFDNVTIFDNTKGQIIDFSTYFLQFKNRWKIHDLNKRPVTKFASPMHCKSVDICFDLIPNGFILMDSDTLVKADISSLWDENEIYVGQIETIRRSGTAIDRVMPYLTYINVPKCKEYGIRYFNSDYMFSLSTVKPNGWFETGSWFYKACNDKKITGRKITIDYFIEHLTSASYMKRDIKKFLSNHQDLYKDTKIIASMTSWPPRIGNLPKVLESMLNQTRQVDGIYVNLSLEEFPNKEKDFPSDVFGFLDMHKDIIHINWVERNTTVYKKIIPTIKMMYEKGDDDYYLLSIDDDCIYDDGYVAKMVDEIKKDPSIGAFNASTASGIIGCCTIYNGDVFEPDIWEKLTDDLINTRISDAYYSKYVKAKGFKVSGKRMPNMYKFYNQDVAPNSGDKASRVPHYPSSMVSNFHKELAKITFMPRNKSSEFQINASTESRKVQLKPRRNNILTRHVGNYIFSL